MNQLGTTETGRKDRIVGLYSRARQLAIGRDYVHALELYDRIAADMPGLMLETPQINYERALCLKALGRIQDAEQAIRACLSVRPDNPEFLRFLSEIRSTNEIIDASRESKVKPEPAKAEEAKEADRLYAESRMLLPLIEKADVKRALRAISLIEEQMIGRWCGDLGDKLLQYLSIVQFARATGSKAIDSIEIGTLFGGSCLAKLFAMRDLGVQGKIVCIDPMTGYYEQQLDPKAGIPVTAEVFFRNIDNFGFPREAIDLRQVKSSDTRAVEGLREKSFATLLIDGDHSYRGVRSDWQNYSKFVSDDGIVLFDDYTNPRWPDIGVFVNELKGSLPRGWNQLGCLGTTLLMERTTTVDTSEGHGVDKEKIYEGLNKCYFSQDCHEKEVIEHLPELLDGVKVFVDIGASLGQYTFHANRYMQEGEILAIEADPVRFEELERNCRKWQLSSGNKLSALLAAVCDKDGQETFYVTNSGKSGGLFKRDLGDESANWSKTVVECVTLDGLFKDKSPDLVKIDVEGAELRVLKGAMRILKEGKTKFLVEVHGGADPKGQKEPVEVFRFMQSFGYGTINFHGRSLFVNTTASDKEPSINKDQTVTAQDDKQTDLAVSVVSKGLRDFAGKYAGRRAFIIGNGPSLNKMDLSKLKDEVTFGVNSIFYNFDKMGFKPTFYVVEDKLVAEDRAAEINALVGMTKIFGTELKYCLKDSQDVVWAKVIYDFSNYPGFPHFSKDVAECLWVGGTVSYLCMQLAYYMGFTEVYLVGFDHNYIIPADARVDGTVITSASGDPNHFHPEYFGRGKRWHDPRLDRMEKAYKRTKEVFEASGRKIFNATVGGRLEIFPRVDYERLLCCDSDDSGKTVDFFSIRAAERIPAVKNELTVKQPQTPCFSHLVLDFTRLCNSKCTYCGIWKMKDGPELGLEAIERVFCSLRPFGLSTCYVTGGEPYISDKIVDIARLLHTYLPKCGLSGATNAVQPNKILERMQKILEIGVPLEVHVSINGSEATHDATRGGPGFFKKAVYLLETLKSAKLPVVASMSLMPQTIADLPYMQEFCAERDIRLMFSWVRQWERYGTVDNQYSTWPEQMKSRLKEIEYLPDTFDCPGLTKRLVITPGGSVYPCEVYNPKILLGNVNEESLESMLTSGRAASIEQLISAKGCKWCQGAGEVDGSPKWMLMDCYRRHSQQYACLMEQSRQAVHMPAQDSRKVIESILSEKSVHQITVPSGQQTREVTGEKKSKVRISAIICTHRNPQFLALAIESLLNQTLQRDLFEIIVVDNNSQDQTKQVVQCYGGVRYVLAEQLGLSHARNAGIEVAQGKIIAFIDDDAEASPGWLQALLRVYDSVPEAWAVGGKVRPIWDVKKPQWLTEKFYRYLSLIEWGDDERALSWPERLIGTNCSFRREAFEAVGGFDTSLGRIGTALLGSEDRGIQKLIHASGHLVYYAPDAVVHHHVPAWRMTEQYLEKRHLGGLQSQAIIALQSEGKRAQADELAALIRDAESTPDATAKNTFDWQRLHWEGVMALRQQGKKIQADELARLLRCYEKNAAQQEKGPWQQVRVSVVVCTHRNSAMLSKTLESLMQQTLGRALYEVIVVDNNSQDLTKQVVSRYPQVRYIHEEKLGLSYARNTGIQAARGDIIAFIDDDAEASAGWLESLLEIYESAPEAWAVGGKVLPIWDATKPEWLTERYYRSLSLVEWGESARPLHWPERIIGTNCSFRRRVFTEIGLFDTNLGRLGNLLLGEEDREIQQRIHGLGHLVYYTPKAIVHHHVPASRMTREYFERRSKGTLVCEKIMALRSQGRNDEADQLSNKIREKVACSDIIPTRQKALAESNLRLAEFKDKHRGRRCVIIGNGPSLNKMDLSFLKNEITFGMNRIYLLFDKWNFVPTYYVSVNPLVIEQSVEQIRQIAAPRFLTLEGLPFTGTADQNIFIQRRPGGAHFSDDPRKGCWWPTVTYAAMQLAYFMGFSEVILIGVDHYFKTKGDANKEIVSAGLDQDHFHPDYFGKGIRWNLPDLEKSEMAYRLAKQAFEATGRRIIDATVDGHLTIFPKADYKEIFFPAAHPVKSFRNALSTKLVDTELDEYFGNKSESIESLTVTTSPKFCPADSAEQQQRYLVSAIVSTYNSERFLRGCLEDLENQTIADRLEIIVVNSGSQQDEESIVKEFQQKYDNTVYIKTEQREGIYAAWNRAVKAARGQFITNVNTDDRHREDALEIMANTLQSNPAVALVYGDQIVTDTANGTFANHYALKVMKQPEYSRERLLFGNCVGSQPMWRGSLHNELGYFDETLTCAGDWDFWLRISNKYPFKHIPEFLGLYYHNECGIEHGRKIHSLYERYIVGRRYGNPYISVIPRYEGKDNPLVSVIIPAYNAAKYIAEAIESVLIQNYKNFELIIIDDGSTDQTKDIIASFKDDRIRYYYQDNSGLAAAYNAGIKNSKGVFIIKLDIDDMMTPDFISKHLMEFEHHPEAELVYCDDCLVAEDTKPIRVIERPEYTDRKLLIRDLFRRGFPVVPFRTCIRRGVFEKIGFFEESLRMAEDYDMMRRFVKADLKAHHLKGAFYIRRLTSDSLSRNFSIENAKFHFDVVKRFTNTFSYDELFPDVAWDKIPAELRQSHAKCLAAVTFLGIGQTYVETKSLYYARTAFDLACSELNDCLQTDPGNVRVRQLLEKSQLARSRCSELEPQAAC